MVTTVTYQVHNTLLVGDCHGAGFIVLLRGPYCHSVQLLLSQHHTVHFTTSTHTIKVLDSAIKPLLASLLASPAATYTCQLG